MSTNTKPPRSLCLSTQPQSVTLFPMCSSRREPHSVFLSGQVMRSFVTDGCLPASDGAALGPAATEARVTNARRCILVIALCATALCEIGWQAKARGCAVCSALEMTPHRRAACVDAIVENA